MLWASPWLWVTLGVVAVGATGGAYLKGRSDGRAVIIAQQVREDQIRLETLQLAQLAAAEEIAKISVTHTTIRQQAETVIREKPIYRDCVNDPGVVGLLDAARENRPAESAGDSGVPGTGAGPARKFW